MSDSPLACVFADISFDPNSVRVDGVSHSPRFGTLASHEIDSRSGRIRNVGGCIAPGEEVDDSGWVRVAVVEVKVREPRSPAFGVHPASNRAYGVSLVGGALPLAREEITWRGATPRATDGKGHRHPNK